MKFALISGDGPRAKVLARPIWHLSSDPQKPCRAGSLVQGRCEAGIGEPMDAQGQWAQLTRPAKRRARQKVTPKSWTSVYMHWHPCAPSTRTCINAHMSCIIHTQISEQIKCCLYVRRLGFRTHCESECRKKNTSFANNKIYGVNLK